MLAQVTLLQQTYNLHSSLRTEESPWMIQRRITSTFILPVQPVNNAWEALAEEAFHITNAPEELLSEPQKEWERIHRNNLAPSLSVGDVVQVTHPHGTEFYLCRSSGWEQGYDEKLAYLFTHLVAVEEKLHLRSKPDGTCSTCGETYWSAE